MELKSHLRVKQSVSRTGFNRTFMELKCHIFARVRKFSSGFNRTFMELKFIEVWARDDEPRF